jgi:hypothetical protein
MEDATEVDEKQLDLGLDKVTQDLASFLGSNPEVKVQLSEGDLQIPLVTMPWGDPSVVIKVPSIGGDYDELVAALNSLLLPPRLSALYHRDQRRLEVIFTARALSPNLKEIDGRKFDFHFKGGALKCHFGGSSDRLLAIAANALFPQNSATRYRSLASFADYLERPMGEGEVEKYIRSQFGRPLSFFVEEIDWQEEETINVLRHISFYLRYYDGIAPFILIHPPEDSTSVSAKVRFVHGTFPEAITSRELNPTLLSFWLAAADADPENKFLYCYRIIEFVSSSYLKNEKLLQVKRILADPALLSKIEPSVDALVGLIREEKPDSVNRFKSVVNELTRREVIWPEICANPQAFTQTVTFDGGFELPKLVDDVDNISRLGPTVILSMAGMFRNIRNALAHGGEDQAGRVILPTARNAKLLQPWVHLIVAVSGEVVLHENHT